jgi:hypothetical protein
VDARGCAIVPALKVRPFTDDERAYIKQVALSRHMDGWVVGRQDSRDESKAKERALRMDLMGAAGEAAFAILWGLHWDITLRHFKGGPPDFAPDPLLGPTGVEVKTTAYARTLTLTAGDVQHNPDRFHWGVYRDPEMVYWVMGYALPAEYADKPQTRTGKWDVPEADLVPASTIIELDYPKSAWDPQSGAQVVTETLTAEPAQPLPTLHPHRG